MRVREYHKSDIEQITALLQANSQAQGGMLYGNFPLAKVTTMCQSALLCLIAEEAGDIVGVVFSFALDSKTLPPIALEIKRRYPKEIQDNWFYGPVCLAENQRGKGMLAELYHQLMARLYGLPIAFINVENRVSLRAHTRLGMRELGTFDLEGKAWVALIGG